MFRTDWKLFPKIRLYRQCFWFMALFGACSISYAVDSFEKLWGLVTYTNHYHDLLFYAEPQIRFVNLGDVYEQFLINTGVGAEVAPKLQFWVGQTFANFSPYNIDEDVASNDSNEYRLWQQCIWVPNAAMVLRSRLEERDSFENAPWSIRLRERGYWSRPFTEKDSLVLSNELFINLKQVPWVVTKTIDQNRAYIGIMHQLTPTIGLNVSYMNQYIFRPGGEDNHVLVLNLFINVA